VRKSSTGVSAIAIAAAAASAYETEAPAGSMSMTPSAKQATRNVPVPQSVLRVSTSGTTRRPYRPPTSAARLSQMPRTRTPKANGSSLGQTTARAAMPSGKQISP